MRTRIDDDCIDSRLDGRPVKLLIDLSEEGGIYELEMLLALGNSYEYFSVKCDPASEEPFVSAQANTNGDPNVFPRALPFVVSGISSSSPRFLIIGR